LALLHYVLHIPFAFLFVLFATLGLQTSSQGLPVHVGELLEQLYLLSHDVRVILKALQECVAACFVFLI